MSSFIEEYSEVWGENPSVLMDEYNYNPVLTEELDNLDPECLNNETFFKIVLWKLNRFPYISGDLINTLKEVSNIEPGQHEQAREIIRSLLKTSGIALPMASTVLRFLNPRAFQIIDDRAYRVLFPGDPKYPTKPLKITEGYLNKSINIYFNYIDRIHEISSDTLPFEDADRILYQLDIKLGKKLGSKI
ncbi:hypothetical protein [Microbulbifer sp. VAAF005]|uniref:hypothetical protein n=1 Tax=Microbulbifer sp. VAAF005 TaxID=3034230 RepID=UPI0024AE1D4B|nr:hypothetical protein [Microbulbifer sp. VAAF005]WHI45965.1 hypothetical protein P0078_19935 [Microbulbifer sp. VAAF005]